MGLAGVPNVDVAGINSAVGLVIGLITLVLLLASAAALIRASLISSQITALRGDRDDLIARVHRLEDDVADAEERAKTLARDLDEEKRARRELQRIVTGRDLLEAIATALATHDEHVAAYHREHEDAAEKRTARIIAAVAAIKGAQAP